MLVCRASQWWTVGVRLICARVWSRSLVDCGVGLVSAKGHQCVTREIVGISPTLIVGGELNQHKSRGSLTSWTSFWGVAGFPPGVRPVGPTVLILG